MMKTEFSPLSIQGVVLDKESRTPIIMLTDGKPNRVLPVTVGPFEASAIIIEMEGMHPPRPLTHDLLAGFFTTHGFIMTGVYIYGCYEDSFLALIRYRKGLRKFTMEVRPSDGIALAVRLEAPIFASEELLASDVGNRLFLSNSDPETAEYLYLKKQPSGATAL